MVPFILSGSFGSSKTSLTEYPTKPLPVTCDCRREYFITLLVMTHPMQVQGTTELDETSAGLQVTETGPLLPSSHHHPTKTNPITTNWKKSEPPLAQSRITLHIG